MNLIIKYQQRIKKNIIADIIGGMLILLFAYAASSKLFDFTQFRMQLEGSPLIGSYAGVIVWLVPSVEIIIVLLLTVKITRILGLYASLILLLIFTLYIAGMLLSGMRLPCSCGGIIQQLSWKQHLLFNLFFLLLSLIGILLERKQKLITCYLN